MANYGLAWSGEQNALRRVIARFHFKRACQLIWSRQTFTFRRGESDAVVFLLSLHAGIGASRTGEAWFAGMGPMAHKVW